MNLVGNPLTSYGKDEVGRHLDSAFQVCWDPDRAWEEAAHEARAKVAQALPRAQQAGRPPPYLDANAPSKQLLVLST